MRRPPHVLLIGAAAAVLGAGLLVLPAATAHTSAPRRVFTGLQRAEAWHAAHEAAMLQRLQSGPAQSGLAAKPLAQGHGLRHVQQASRDTLPAFMTSQTDTQIEPDVAIDPNNPRYIVAGVQQARFSDGGSADTGYATSQDGGRTWTKSDYPGLTEDVGGPYERASDPAVAFGPDGSVYIVSIPFGAVGDPCVSSVSIQRSTDHGLSFGPYVDVQHDDQCAYFNDKEWVTVDTFKNSPHYGRIYVMWSRFGPSFAPADLRYSDDQGQTWSDLIDISDPTALTEGTLPLVQPNGDLTVVYDQTKSGLDYEVSQTSHNGGKTFDAPVTIDQFEGVGVPGERTGGLPSAAVDPATGMLYASWQDARFKGNGLNDVVLSTSTNGGKTWSKIVKINPEPKDSGISSFTPDVAAYGGNVFAIYSTRARVNGIFLNTQQERSIVSPDGGASFEKERVLGPTIDLTWAAVAGGKFLGDYVGVAAASGNAQAVWCVSSRPPFKETYHQTLWTATISD